MKLLLSFFLFISLSFAGELEIFHNLEKATESAKKDNMKVLMMLSQEGCVTCEYMLDVVFDNEDVIDFLNTAFKVVELDIHKDKIPNGFRAYGTPTFYILDINGKKIGRQIVGAQTIPNFLKTLKKSKSRF